MFITTSRDPSAKARRFARALASFLSIDYINRGKQRPGREDAVLVVTEDHGNPAGIVKHGFESEEKLIFRLSGEIQARRLQPAGTDVAVVGQKEIALPIARFLEKEWLPQAGRAQVRRILVEPGIIEFLDRDLAWIRLKT
jgi:rRNA maturation protein Rpf1